MGKNYEDLRVWSASIDFAEEIYKLTKEFPKEEIYGLTNQIRRSSVSVSSNIAEGCARGGTNEFIRFLNISSGSLGEVKTQLIISQRIGFIDKDTLNSLCKKIDEIGKMINALKNSINKTSNQ